MNIICTVDMSTCSSCMRLSVILVVFRCTSYITALDAFSSEHTQVEWVNRGWKQGGVRVTNKSQDKDIAIALTEKNR